VAPTTQLEKVLEPDRPTDEVQQDPWDAQPGAELPDGSTVLRVLGAGACGCQKRCTPHATCWYSWISPPTRSRRRTLWISSADR
jgi:hypothetical protein